MFDATKGQQAVTSQIETLSDEFAARFTEMGPREQLAFLQKANVLLDDPSQVSAFQAGTFAQNSAGQPAAQLGTGGNTSNPRQSLTAALNDFGASPGQLQAVLRVLNAPGDPGHIEVDDTGKSTQLTATERERDTAKTERDAARVALLHERDPNRDGSLAKQLADVTAERDAARAERDTARANIGGYDQTAALAALAAVDQAIEDQVGKMGGRVEGRSELKKQLNTLLSIIHLSRA